MSNEYVTIAHDVAVIEKEINKSIFIGYAIGVDNVEQAVAFVDKITKKHYDATHNCYAYVVDDRAKFSDDGEPQGTAGMPIYDCIKKQGINRVCVVVTRYFGGIKLGAGGLVRAYGGACSDVLNTAVKIAMRRCVRFDVTMDYSLLKTVQRSLNDVAKTENIVYDTNVTLSCIALEQSYDTIIDIVTQNTNGRAIIKEKERVICSY